MSLAKKFKVNLPKDWIVVNSTSFPDRVYYFNVRTGKSSWQEPSHESNKSKSGQQSQKRKLTDLNDKDEISSEQARSPSSEAPSKSSERRMLRANRCSELPKVQETPQMKEMRLKILENKQSKVVKNEVQKLRGVKSQSRDKLEVPIPGKSSRSVKSQRQYTKLQTKDNVSKLINRGFDAKSISSAGEIGGNKSQYGSWTSYIKSMTKVSSNVTKNTRIQTGLREQKISPSKSSSTSQNMTLKKNLAKKRLDTLKKSLNSQLRGMETVIDTKVAKHMPSQNTEPQKCHTASDINKKNESNNPKSLIEGLPSIFQNVESRFKAIRARLTTNLPLLSDGISEGNKETGTGVAKVPKIVKTNKRSAKKGGKAGTAKAETVAASPEEPHTSGENQCRDSFWEEMEWEPIEEEKVIFEVQEVRVQLSNDQGNQPTLLDCTMNGLELSQVFQNTDKRILYVVVDTNVYLSNLKTVTNLLEDSGKNNNHYKPVVVVPWSVLQELDYIKDNKSKTKSVHLQKSAKTAVDMLFRYFSSKHPRLKGQTAADAAANRMKFQVESPDDEILQSCLQICELGYAVTLLSNDKNLCNKAMIHNIPTCGRHESIQKMLSLNINEAESRSAREPSQINKSQVETVDAQEAEISDDIFCETKAMIKHFLSTIVSKEMENLYGENWKKYTTIQPPWSVTDVLKCTSKHWIAAISDVFVKPAESLVKQLTNIVQDAPKYGQSLSDVREVLDVFHDLVQTVDSKKYLELSENMHHNIKELMDTCKKKLKEFQENRSLALNERENNNLNEEERANNAFKYFDQIWTFTNNFCGTAADIAGIPHSITYKKCDPSLPAETINRIQPELVFSLNQLIHALRTVLNDDEYLTVDHPALIALYQSLANYFPNSGELNDSRSLDIVDLLYCIKVKKEFLRTGLAQLQDLCYQFCRIADFRSTTAVFIHG